MSEDKGAFELGDKLKLSRDSFMTLETETKTAIANAAYAAGRKAAEKDFQELLEFSDSMSKWARDLSGQELVYRFRQWKRSHGFVDENSEKEMRELWHILHD